MSTGHSTVAACSWEVKTDMTQPFVDKREDDRVSRKGKAIGSVRPSVCPSVRPSVCWLVRV